MAVPTAPSSCFAESTAPTTTVVYWTDNSSDEVGFKIERSLTSGSGFVEVGQAANSETSFFDTGLTTATRYFYRVRAFNADGNSTYTNEGDVTTQTCDGVAWPGNDLILPRGGEEVIDDLATRTEQWANQVEGTITDCSVNGAVVIDLSLGCNHVVTMTEDINSISIINADRCDGGTIDFDVPAGSAFNISGFPSDTTSNFGFESGAGRTNLNNTSLANRRFSLPFTVTRSSGAGSGNRPRSTNNAKPKAAKPPGMGGGSGGGGGTGGGAALAISCEFSNGTANASCSMSCTGDQILLFNATGGVPPYTWSTTGGTLSTVTGSLSRLDPPANPGSGEAGTAYKQISSASGACVVGPCGGTPISIIDLVLKSFGCGDGLIHSGTIATQCAPATVNVSGGGGGGTCTPTVSFSCSGTTLTISPTSVDCRSASMITAGCSPCGITMPGIVVTVTDGRGISVSKTVTV